MTYAAIGSSINTLAGAAVNKDGKTLVQQSNLSDETKTTVENVETIITAGSAVFNVKGAIDHGIPFVMGAASDYKSLKDTFIAAPSRR